MRRLLLCVSILLVFANCKRAALPAAGAAIALGGASMMAANGGSRSAPDMDGGHDEWGMDSRDTDLGSSAGAMVFATGAIIFIAGVVAAGVEHQRDEEREARRAEEAELEAWRVRMNAGAAGER